MSERHKEGGCRLTEQGLLGVGEAGEQPTQTTPTLGNHACAHGLYSCSGGKLCILARSATVGRGLFRTG